MTSSGSITVCLAIAVMAISGSGLALEPQVRDTEVSVGRWTVVQRDLGCSIRTEPADAGSARVSLWRPFRGQPHMSLALHAQIPAEIGAPTGDHGAIIVDDRISLPVKTGFVTMLDPRERDLAPEYHLILTLTSNAEHIGPVMSAATKAKVEVKGIVLEPIDLGGLGVAWEDSNRCLERVGLALMGISPGVRSGQTPPRRDQPLPREYPGRWIEPENYPREAIAAKAEGTTRVAVDVDQYGYPTDCRIVQTAGSAILDAVTCERLMKKAHFFPAIGNEGVAVQSVWESAVTWRLGA